MSRMINCKGCGKEVSKGAKACPNCGRDSRNFFMKHKIITTVLVLVVIGVGVGVGTTSSDEVKVVGDSKPAVSDGQSTTPEQPKAPDYEVAVEGASTDGMFSTTVAVKITNNKKDVGYLQVTVPVYDNDGIKIADGIANTGSLKKGETARLDIVIFEVLKEGEYKLGEFEITAF